MEILASNEDTLSAVEKKCTKEEMKQNGFAKKKYIYVLEWKSHNECIAPPPVSAIMRGSMERV